MTYRQLIIAIFLTGALMFIMRAIPFVVFSKKEPPKFLRFAEKYIPAIAIAVLFAICLKEKTTDLIFNSETVNSSEIIAGIAGTTAAILLHIWKNNAMLSIFGSTILFLILKNLL